MVRDRRVNLSSRSIDQYSTTATVLIFTHITIKTRLTKAFADCYAFIKYIRTGYFILCVTPEKFMENISSKKFVAQSCWHELHHWKMRHKRDDGTLFWTGKYTWYTIEKKSSGVLLNRLLWSWLWLYFMLFTIGSYHRFTVGEHCWTEKNWAYTTSIALFEYTWRNLR